MNDADKDGVRVSVYRVSKGWEPGEVCRYAQIKQSLFKVGEAWKVYNSARITELQLAGLEKGESPSEVCRYAEFSDPRHLGINMRAVWHAQHDAEKQENFCEGEPRRAAPSLCNINQKVAARAICVCRRELQRTSHLPPGSSGRAVIGRQRVGAGAEGASLCRALSLSLLLASRWVLASVGEKNPQAATICIY